MYSSTIIAGRSSTPKYSDHNYRSSYQREYDYNDEETESVDALEREREQNELDYNPRRISRNRSFGRGDFTERSSEYNDYPRTQRPLSYRKIDLIESRETISDYPSNVRSRLVRRAKSDVFERPVEEDRQDQIDGLNMHRSSMENLSAITTPPNVRSFKDQETMIQEIKKENFDLKLRLYMEQKERERLHEEYQQKVVILETDLTESLDELSDALEREKDYEISLNNARRREKALVIKQRRLEETMREQDEEIKYLADSKSMMDLSQGPPCDAMTQTDRPFYEERGIDTGTIKGRESGVRSSGRSRPNKDTTENVDGKSGNKQPPEGVDLLNCASIARKEQILGEARRRRTLKSKKDKQRRKTLDEMPEVDQTQKVPKKKKSFFNKLLCCCSSKRSDSEAYERTIGKA